ncbi:hypothetical protein C8R42DRAFT_646729 [Lentinula raphanica]|nr:hypothetical protein C8R42DRAFT_646729 [Lentinula raphanica]
MSSQLSVEELIFITKLNLALETRIGLLRGTIKLTDIITNNILPVSSNALETPSGSVPMARASISGSVPMTPPSGSVPMAPPSMVPKETQQRNVPQSLSSAATVESQSDLTFPLLDSVLRLVNELNPFTGSSSEKAMLWNQVHQGYLDKGGSTSRNVEWLKKKVNEAVDQHESIQTEKENLAERNQANKSRRITHLVTKIVNKHHVVLASLLEAIGYQRSKSYQETTEQSAKRRQADQKKAEIGKEMVAASLVARRRRILSQHPSINSVSDDEVEIVGDDDIMILGDNGEFHTIESTAGSATSLVKKEDIETTVSGSSDAQTIKRSRSDADDEQRRKTRVESRKGKKIRTTLHKRKSNVQERSMRAIEDLSQQLFQQLAQANKTHEKLLEANLTFQDRLLKHLAKLDE